MKTEFEMSMMGELRFFLGLQIQQLDTGIYISKTKYVLEILKKFDFENVNGKETLIALFTSLDEDLSGKRVDEKKYWGMIGSLLYLTASKPDIRFATCFCARFQFEPKESHFNAVKRIFRYLNSTKDLGLFYPKAQSLDLLSYSDADYAGSRIDQKSTSSTCHFIEESLAPWLSKKQTCVSLSTTEAEYIAASLACS